MAWVFKNVLCLSVRGQSAHLIALTVLLLRKERERMMMMITTVTPLHSSGFTSELLVFPTLQLLMITFCFFVCFMSPDTTLTVNVPGP